MTCILLAYVYILWKVCLAKFTSGCKNSITKACRIYLAPPKKQTIGDLFFRFRFHLDMATHTMQRWMFLGQQRVIPSPRSILLLPSIPATNPKCQLKKNRRTCHESGSLGKGMCHGRYSKHLPNSSTSSTSSEV